MEKEKTLNDYKEKQPPKLTFKGILKKAIGLSGYTVTKSSIKLSPQRLRQITAEHFFDFYFSTINPEAFFFIQLGANDGKTRDRMSTYISKYSLHGLLVEPQTEVFDKLKENYIDQPQLQFVNAAISDTNGAQTFFRVKRNLINDRNYFETTAISSLEREIIKKSVKKRIPHIIEKISDNLDDYIEEVEVPTLTLSSLLKKNNIKKVDLLFTDCDGYDGKIIKSIDFSIFRPNVINYESCVLSDEERSECESILEGNGYRLFRHGNDTCAFIVQ